jgi:hypothetical protein
MNDQISISIYFIFGAAHNLEHRLNLNTNISFNKGFVFQNSTFCVLIEKIKRERMKIVAPCNRTAECTIITLTAKLIRPEFKRFRLANLILIRLE